MRNRTLSDNMLTFSSYLFIIIFAAVCFYPFILVVMSSFTDEIAILKNGFQIIPEAYSLAAYKLMLSSDVIPNAYMVTIFVTAVGTLLSMTITSALSYALSMNTIRLKNGIAFYVYFTMLFSGGLVPSYLLISKYLNMKNNVWVLIIPMLVNPWNMFLLRNFFKTVPAELSESAKIDGADDIYILFKIIIPVSLPAIATIGLFYALAYWNEWFNAMLYITKEKLFPLQLLIMRVLRNILFAGEIVASSGISTTDVLPSYSARFATTCITIGPIIFVYPFIQKYFIKGLMVGSIKG